MNDKVDMAKKHMSLRGGAEESIKVTSLYVIRFFASVPLALNDKVDMAKKHMSLIGGAEEFIKVTSLYVVRFFAIALNDKIFIDYYYLL